MSVGAGKNKTIADMFGFLRDALKDKDTEWLKDRLFKTYLLYNKAMNLITKLGLINEYMKGIDPELFIEMQIAAEFLSKAFKIIHPSKQGGYIS